MRWIGNVDDIESARSRQIKPVSGGGDKCRTGQDSVWIETNGFAFLEKIIVRISIDERGDVANDESFFAVGDINARVEEMDRLLFVFGKMLPCGIERECAWQRKTGCVFRVNPRALSKRRDRRADDPLRKSFLVGGGDVENFKATGTVRGIKIFAAQNDILNVVATVLVAFGQKRAAI